MNLHRSSAKADWEKIEPSAYNVFQKMAASTGGFVTPANAITVVGLVIVIYGLLVLVQGQVWLGFGLLIGGRLLDIADGLAAEATGTKSPLGELFDAAADKIGTVLTIVALIVATIAPWWLMLALAIPQLVILLIVFYKRQKNIRIHPTRPGKLSMAFVWASIAGLIITQVISEKEPLLLFTYLLVIGSFVLGVYAAWQYATGRKQD